MGATRVEPGTAAAATAPHPYALRCRGCGAAYEDDGYLLNCTREHGPALLVTEYEQKRFEPDARAGGVFRYRGWLPARRVLEGGGACVTYQSEALCRMTGLRNLWIAFNGHWPEHGGDLETGTFKELEAWTVLSRLPLEDHTVLVIASAGNTAAAFARICSLHEVPCLIVVPDTALAALQFVEPLTDAVKVVVLGAPADYFDAIQLAGRVSRLDGFVAEGGVCNVGRRDGLGTVLLDAVETIGRLPDYYFQAVGSGAGGIAAYEAACKLLGDGRFGDTAPKLMLSQNAPFAPMYHSWKRGRRELVEFDDDEARIQVQQLAAKVLSNRRPPFATAGGVYDALAGTGGDMLVTTNEEALQAGRMFEAAEGIDLDPASAVAFASLLQAAREHRLDPDAVVALNITGGGRRMLRDTVPLVPVRPALELAPADLGREDTPARLTELFGQ